MWRQTELAVKVMKLKLDETNLLREIAIMEKIRHPSIISLMAVTKTSHWYLVLEYFESRNLHEIIFEEKKTL